MSAHVDYADWAAMRETAERLLADRVRTDHEAVAAEKLAPSEADARDRVARSLVALWRAVELHHDIPELPAGDIEIRADLNAVAKIAEKASAARPADKALALYAARLATLAYHHRPYRDGAWTASIVFCHECNQQARAERASRSPTAPAELPPAPPLRQPALLS
jgi:hypothetical protein